MQKNSLHVLLSAIVLSSCFNFSHSIETPNENVKKFYSDKKSQTVQSSTCQRAAEETITSIVNLMKESFSCAAKNSHSHSEDKLITEERDTRGTILGNIGILEDISFYLKKYISEERKFRSDLESIITSYYDDENYEFITKCSKWLKLHKSTDSPIEDPVIIYE